MPSRTEQILEKLKTLLQAGCAAKVERNAVAPEKIPAGGLVIIRDGNPGAPDYVLGGFSNVYYSHSIEVEIYIQEGDTAQRDAKFDQLALAIGTTLEAYPDFQGLIDGLSYGRPEIATQAIDGGPAIKTGVMVIAADYEVLTPLS